MKSEPVQLQLPGFDREFEDWKERYRQQIGEDSSARNRSGIEIRPMCVDDCPRFTGQECR